MDSIVQIKWGKKMYEGQVTYEEGDLVEVVFTEPISIAVGDPVNCILTRNYSEVQNIQGVVLGKDEKRLILFHSPTVTEFREQRRRYPRFDVDLQGRLVPADGSGECWVKVTNISLGGLAFHTQRNMAVKTSFKLSMDLPDSHGREERVDLKGEIIHIRDQEKYLYGCKVTGINSKNLHVIRRYILNRQLEMLKSRM